MLVPGIIRRKISRSVSPLRRAWLLVAAAALLLCASGFAGTTTNAVWTGGSGITDNWNDTANWSGGNQPLGGNGSTVIHFAGSSRTTPNNDYGAFTLESQIVFDSGASSFTLNGNAIKLNFKIENNSSNLQTYNMSGLSFAPGASGGTVELDPTAGDLTINTPGSAVFLDNNAELDVFGSHTLTLNASVQDGGGSSGKFVMKGPATVIFNAGNTYSGGTFVNSGSLQFDNSGSASGTLNLGDASGSNDASIYIRTAAGGKTVGNNITVASGSTGTLTIGGLNTSGTNTYNGTITLNHAVNLEAATGGTVNFNTITASATKTATINGGGTVQLSGSSDNLNLAATVNNGTLILNKTSSSSVHALGAGLIVNSGGTVSLGGSGGDQIFNSMAVTLNGGTFKPNAHSEGTGSTSLNGLVLSGSSSNGIGALTLQINSTLDFGASGVATLTFASFSRTAGTLNILNYANTTENIALQKSGIDGTDDRLIFNQDQTSNLAFISFNGISATEIALGGGFFEIVPIPEASTWVSATLSLVGLIAFSQRRLFRR